MDDRSTALGSWKASSAHSFATYTVHVHLFSAGRTDRCFRLVQLGSGNV